MNIIDYLSEVKNFFDCFNRDLFDGELPEPILIIQSAGKKKYLGWCSRKMVWENLDKSESRYEITITSEYLSRPIIEIAETVLHEQCHLYANIHEIKDVSGAYYHNKKFKKIAEDHGLIVEDAPVFGWAFTKFSAVGVEAFNKINVDVSAFDFSRIASSKTPVKVERVSKTKKYSCLCGTEIKSKKESLNIVCKDCDSEFEIMDN